MRCLYCYKLLEKDETDFHPWCSLKFFGQTVSPELPYNDENMEELATKILQSQTTLTGVQAKISLHLTTGENKNEPKRFTIVGLWEGYILKPPSDHYPQLPEVEDLTMHLANLANISVVPHSLIRLKAGSLAYITKRIDRSKKEKFPMEDMCQLTEKLTEDKYRGSYEQIAKIILKYSANPGLDLVNYFELVLFSFLTGNADMHLKNFSLIYHQGIGHILAPAYDMVATAMVNPADDEDLALTLNARKRKIKRSDFIAAFNTLKLEAKQQENIFNKMDNAKSKWMDFIDISYINEEFKKDFKSMILERFARIE